MRVFGKRSEAHMLVHVEGVKNRDARLVGLDSRAAVPAHLRERMIGFQDHERISDIGEERYRLHGLQAVRAEMHQAFEGGPIKPSSRELPGLCRPGNKAALKQSSCACPDAA